MQIKRKRRKRCIFHVPWPLPELDPIGWNPCAVPGLEKSPRLNSVPNISSTSNLLSIHCIGVLSSFIQNGVPRTAHAEQAVYGNFAGALTLWEFGVETSVLSSSSPLSRGHVYSKSLSKMTPNPSKHEVCLSCLLSIYLARRRWNKFGQHFKLMDLVRDRISCFVTVITQTSMPLVARRFVCLLHLCLPLPCRTAVSSEWS